MAKYDTPLSSGGELLVERLETHHKLTQQEFEFDVLVVGSGYGGSVAAARLSEDICRRGTGEPLTICVLERGREHLPGSFPTSFAGLPGHVRINRFDTPELTGNAAGLFDVRIGADVSVLLGNGLGGGSLINAGVAEIPDAEIFKAWPVANLHDRDAALGDYFKTAAAMLGAGPADTKKLRKYREFAALAEGLGLEPRPANIAVTFEDKADNGHGVTQQKCINCGDCVTGCNYHAKNTLPMNYLARAKRNGACLYHCVTVSHLEKVDESRWAVYFYLTPRSGSPRKRRTHRVLARHVVLAAGALGSTEILKRSEKKGTLQLSKALGSRFSCNGDMIGSLYNQDCYVNAAPPEHARPNEREVGPTITGIATRAGKPEERFVLEELAIPGALRRVFEEVVTTAGLPYALGGFDSTLFFGRRPDPVAVDPDAVDRSQVLAAIGKDSGKGRLELVFGRHDEANPKVADGVVTVHWPEAGKDTIYGVQDACLEYPTSNGGEYVRSPLWQPLPPDMSAQLGGKKPEGKLFTVHPLGGCPMADDAASGVVNDLGQVYRAAPGEQGVHENLQVLDGSIIPGALGINPLLTITGLAERAIDQLLQHHKEWHRAATPPAPPQARSEAPGNSRVVRIVRRAGRILGAHACADRFRQAPSARWPQPQGERSALRFAERVEGELDLGSQHKAELTLHFEAVGENGDDIPAFLRNGKRELRIESGALRAWPAVGGKEEEEEKKKAPQAGVSGCVVLLERWRLSAFRRTYTALSAFLPRRGIYDYLLKRRAERVAAGGPADDPSDERLGRRLTKLTPLIAFISGVVAEVACLLWPLWLLLKRVAPSVALAIVGRLRRFKFLPFVVLAYQTGEARRLKYRLRLEKDLKLASGYILPKGTRIEGRKILRYTRHGNPWWQLFELPVSIRRPWSLHRTRGRLRVDLGYFFRRYATQLQITRQPHLPAGLVDLASTVLFLLRMVSKVHFWSFRLPEYQKHDPEIDKKRTPGPLPGLECDRVEVKAQGEQPALFLTHYWKKGEVDRSMPPVVLFHGLGASGNQFATPRLKTNLVQHLAGLHRDVWVAEMRHSIALRRTSEQQWKLDEIALGDVSRIVREVLAQTRKRKVDVVAHCIGSAMFCTAALHGDLEHEALQGDEKSKSMVNAAVLMQVGPLITLSEGTRIRAYLAAFLRRYMMEELVDFSVDDEADWIDSLVDRVLATYPYPLEEVCHHDLDPRRQPLHLANCNRWAAIDGRMIEHKNLDKEMLLALGEILGHANLTTWEQTIHYAFLGRLTNREACNSYVTDANIGAYFGFPTRFIHGEKNDVFLVETSRRSCELLKQVHGKNHLCDMVVIEGYSHLDPLIGARAHEKVYPHISGFLDHPSGLYPMREESEWQMFRQPLIGPVVGWTRRIPQNGGRWTTRLWCRIDDTTAPASVVLIVPRKGPQGTVMEDSIKLVRPHAGRVDTLVAVDVELAADDDLYEIEVSSIHLPDRQHLQLQEVLQDAKEQSVDDRGGAEMALASLLEAETANYEEFREEIAQIARLPRHRGEGCTTDPAYDQPLGSALLKPEVLRQNSAGGGLRFAFASCRYGASVVDRERADALFGKLRRLIDDADPEKIPGLLLLVGDQIYADQTAGVFDAGNRRERFYEAYREAWTAPNARAVLSQLPTYMMMDDHEIGDNWHPDDYNDLDKTEKELRRDGLAAFQEYQLLHSPRQPGGFWYDFEAGGFPFFVLDTRSGRDRSGRIIGPDQLKAFKDWLTRQDRQAPKFVVSPSVVVPFRRDSGPEHAYAARSDGWDGHPESLREVFELIHGVDGDPGYDNVVFLCGDAHLSVASRIRFVDAAGQPRGAHAYCVVSSGLYAPFPFANSKPEQHLDESGERRQPLGGGVFMEYTVERKSWLKEDNFTVVDVRQVDGRWRIDVRLVGDTTDETFELTQQMHPGRALEPEPVSA